MNYLWLIILMGALSLSGVKAEVHNGKLKSLPADTNKIPILQTQESPGAGFMQALQNLESAIGNTQSELETATNALIDLQAVLSTNLNVTWPHDKVIGAVKLRKDNMMTESLPAENNLGRIRLDSQKQSLDRVAKSFDIFKNALDEAKHWDDKGLRANQKCLALLKPYDHVGGKRLADAMMSQLRYSNQLKKLEYALGIWDSEVESQVGAIQNRVSRAWNADRLKTIRSSQLNG